MNKDHVGVEQMLPSTEKRRSARDNSGSMRSKVKAVLKGIEAIEPDTFVGIYDFSYAPYALGDCLTWQENVTIGAIEKGYKKVRLCLVADPDTPSCSLQPHINITNYVGFVQELYPAFFSCPLTVAVHVFRDQNSFNLFLIDSWRKGISSWPVFNDHFNRQLDYISHKKINAFYEKNGSVPKLVAPTGYAHAVERLVQDLSEKFVVAVNIRQSQLSAVPANVYRDSPIDVWHEFFRLTTARYPDVLFFFLGRYGEWDLELMRHPNVIIMRTNGYSLGHELAMVHSCDLFMGTSSGFATAATFSNTPYVITNMEKRASTYIDVPVGASRYPFAQDNQVLHWERETLEFLAEQFERTYHAVRVDRRCDQVKRTDA